jgi:hypothetical protein
MIWKRYQNEWIVLIAFVLMLGGYLYKNMQISTQSEAAAYASRSVAELKEVIALQKIWSDKKTTLKVDRLQTIIPGDKIKWSSKNKKVKASYKGLTSSELNTLVTKILNLPVEIQKLKIQKSTTSYDVEFKCKW